MFLFPLIFVMTAVAVSSGANAALGQTAQAGAHGWSFTSFWCCLGYAALVLTALASVFYLIQERQLKRKKSMALLERLPPLGTLDNMISKSLGFGFVLLTVEL